MNYRGTRSGFAASALIITLLATIIFMPMKYVDAQRTKLGDVIPDNMQKRMDNLKSEHPELGALADKMQTMNVTQATEELAALLEFGQTMMSAVKNLQGNMSAAQGNTTA